MIGALEGFKVLDLTHQVAGPFCTMLLADLGADVIKIESPLKGDLAREWAVVGPSVFLALNRNKRSLTLNLKHAKGKEVLQKMVRECDVLVENFTPGTFDKLGLGYDVLSKLNEKLVYCSLSGFGQEGGYGDRPAWDPVIQAMSGLMMVTGEKDRPPVRIGTSLVDMGSGLYAAHAILAALIARNKMGKGQKIDVSMFDSSVSWMTFWMVYHTLTGKLPERMGSSWLPVAPYRVYSTKDSYVFIGASSDAFFNSLCDTIMPDLKKDDRFKTLQDRVKNRDELDSIIQEQVSRWNGQELLSRLLKLGVPCAPLNNVDGLIKDGVLISRGMVVDFEYPGLGHYKTAGIPIKLSESPGSIRSRPPQLGEHSEQILSSLGYDTDQIRRLREEGAI